MKFKASPIVKQFWLLNSIHASDVAYNIPSVFTVKGSFNVTCFKLALERLISRHEILHSNFVFEDSTLWQVVNENYEIPFEHLTIEGENEVLVKEELIKRIAYPFNLKSDSLIRTSIFEHSKDHYTVLILLHHSVVDLATKDQFGRELTELYNCALAGNNPTLEPVKLPYSSFNKEFEEFEGTEDYQNMVNYWKGETSLLEEELNLPEKQGAIHNNLLNGNRVYFNFSKIENNAIKAFCKTNVTTPFTFLLSSYYVLLSRYSLQNDLAIGVPLSNRRKEAYKKIAGCFVNTVPIVIAPETTPSFKEAMDIVRKKLLFAHRNQEVPTQTILNLAPRKYNSPHSVYKVGFTSEHPMKLGLNGGAVKPLNVSPEGAQLDLFLTYWEDEEGLSGYFEYNSDIFEDSFINQLSKNFKHLVGQLILSSTNQSIDTYDLLAINEIEFLSEVNNTRKEYPLQTHLLSFFEERAIKNPEQIALIVEGRSYTYERFNKDANKLAHYLIEKGLEIEQPVAICMVRSYEMMCAIYATLKAGGYYVPIDPNFPDERKKFIYTDTACKLVFSDTEVHSENSITNICLPRDWNAFEGHPETTPDIKISPQSLAYVIYTSGSTGNPKGVMVEQHSVVNRLYWMQDEYPIGTDDVLIQKTPTTFDVSVWELFWWAMFGSKLVMLKPGGERNPDELLYAIEQYRVNVIHFVPSMLGAFLNYLKLKNEIPKHLKFIFSSGEELTKQLHDTYKSLFSSQTSLINLYGPTEATVDVSCFDCTQTVPHNRIPIGTPISNTMLAIVNEQNLPQPLGATGEIVIGGLGLARGYLNRLELNEEKFVPTPSLLSSYSPRMYKTGDLGKFLPDGNIIYLGRNDSQVKVNGIRIELGEIESSIRSLNEVKEAVVLLDKSSNSAQLLAFVTTENNINNRTELLNTLRNKLPEALIPKGLFIIDTIPVTSNGKADRKSLLLQTANYTNQEIKTLPLQATNETEQKLILSWKKILNTDKVDTNTNFFELGGTSISIIELCTQIMSDFNRSNIQVSDLFQYTTVQAQAGFLNKTETTKPSNSAEKQNIKRRKEQVQRMRQLRNR